MFLAQENNENQPKPKEGIADLEAELIAALEEIENLKNLNEKREQHHQLAKNLLVKRLIKATQKKEAQIKSLNFLLSYV